MASRFTHREIFFAHNGPGPYTCAYCEELVEFEDVMIHHTDHDHDNNTPSNLAGMHRGCHRKYHIAYRMANNQRSGGGDYERPKLDGIENAIPYTGPIPHWPADRKK